MKKSKSNKDVFAEREASKYDNPIRFPRARHRTRASQHALTQVTRLDVFTQQFMSSAMPYMSKA